MINLFYHITSFSANKGSLIRHPTFLNFYIHDLYEKNVETRLLDWYKLILSWVICPYMNGIWETKAIKPIIYIYKRQVRNQKLVWKVGKANAAIDFLNTFYISYVKKWCKKLMFKYPSFPMVCSENWR